jgi:hypothetical protein
LILILAVISQKWPGRGEMVSLVMMGILLIGLWVLFIATIQQTYQPVQGSIMFVPLPAFCLIGLYWIRYWAIGPKQLLWEDSV